MPPHLRPHKTIASFYEELDKIFCKKAFVPEGM